MTTPQSIIAVGYLRVSSLGQVDQGGFGRQEDAIRLWCQSTDTKLEHVYREEGVAGKLGEESRPAFQQMVADLLGNGCRTIVVESLDRLARQYDIQQQLATYLASKGLTLISANTGEDITAALMGDPMRRALVQIQGIFAELDKNLLIAKLKKGRDRKKAMGARVDGRPLYGEKQGELEQLTLMRQLRSENKTLHQVRNILNAQGLKARSGKDWSVGALHRILSR